MTDACLKYMGAGHTVRNNVFAFARHYLIIRRIDQGDLVFEQNILCSDNGQIFAGRWDKLNYISDSNIYWDTSGKEMDFAEMSFGEWPKIGNDLSKENPEISFQNLAMNAK